MTENKTISLRIPENILNSIDNLAKKQYPNRSGSGFNRTQVILDAVESYLENSSDNTTQYDVNIIDEKINNAIAAFEDRIMEKLPA